jgi:hypothetical protein
VSSVPTFGQIVRAARMGFHWTHHGCFLRISGSSPFRSDVYPPVMIPQSERRKGEFHRVWWPTFSGEPGLDTLRIECLRNVKRVKLPFSFWFNDEGRTVC